MIDVINKWAERPGTQWDCALFACECSAAVTGVDPAAAFDYVDEDDAERLLDEWGSLEAMLRHVYGEPVETYKDGDLAIVEQAGRQSLGVVYGDRLILRVANGVTDWPVSRATAIWST